MLPFRYGTQPRIVSARVLQILWAAANALLWLPMEQSERRVLMAAIRQAERAQREALAWRELHSDWRAAYQDLEDA